MLYPGESQARRFVKDSSDDGGIQIVEGIRQQITSLLHVISALFGYDSRQVDVCKFLFTFKLDQFSCSKIAIVDGETRLGLSWWGMGNLHFN
jgi:hypothetical protein